MYDPDPTTIGHWRVSIKEPLERDGYAVVRDVFSAEEIAWMRGEITAMLRTNSRPVNGGVGIGPVPCESDLAGRLLTDARLASHCNGELPCEIHVHADTVNDWHPDLEPPASDAVFTGAPAWIYKTAIFLQDHPDRDGLSVVPGSHKEGNTPRTPLHIATRAGDIIVFDMRIQHAGRIPNRAERLIYNVAVCLHHQLRLLDCTGFQRPSRLFRRLERLLRPAPAAERVAIFLSFVPHRDMYGRYAAFREQYSKVFTGLDSSLLAAGDPHSRRDALWNSYRYITAIIRSIGFVIEGPPPAGRHKNPSPGGRESSEMRS